MSLQIANTIADQIGGRAFLMMGTRCRVGSSDALMFDIRGCAAWNKIQIRLDPSDTYTVEFFKVRQLAVLASKSFSRVYAEDLNQLIETQTGLYLSL